MSGLDLFYIYPETEDWDAWDLGQKTPVQRVKGEAGKSGAPLRPRAGRPGGNIVRPDSAAGQALRKKVDSVIQRPRSVMVKISGGGKSMRRIADHWAYISRNGEIPLEDEDGDTVKGRDELKELREEWQHGGYPIPDEGGRRREAFNIVLSMPAGTRPEGVRLAVRDFAAREFAGHQYVMALHTQDTDPDDKPSPHPHVHLCVKACGMDGRRLNPRKADLHRWREGFAEALREHGIEATATTRAQRLARERGEPQFVRYKRERMAQGYTNKRGEPERPLHTVGRSQASPDRVARAKAKEDGFWRDYGDVLYQLTASGDEGDRRRAAGLMRYLQECDRGRAAQLHRQVQQRVRDAQKDQGRDAAG